MYPSTSLFIAVGQLAIVVLITFSYPLQLHPCRNCLDKVFLGRSLVKRRSGEDEEALDEHAGGEMSMLKHALLTGAIILFGFTIAYNMDNLQLGKQPESPWDVFSLIHRCGQFSRLLGQLGRQRYPLFFQDSSSGR